MTNVKGHDRSLRRILLRGWVLVWLMLVWVLLWGNVSAANVLGGLAVAVVVTVLFPLPPVPVEGRVHPLSVLRLIVQVAYYLVMSSLQLAWQAIKPGPPPRSAVLRVHFALKSDLVLALGANIMNLIPGGIVLEIDQTRRLLYIHVLDVSTDRAVKRFTHEAAAVERLLINAFERGSHWQPSPERES